MCLPDVPVEMTPCFDGFIWEGADGPTIVELMNELVRQPSQSFWWIYQRRQVVAQLKSILVIEYSIENVKIHHKINW